MTDTSPESITKATAPVPYRQIRASYDDETITVYQAYNRSIASAAVAAQKLNASPDFKPGRMTWIKPSWSWMLYRAGYSYKDPGQERILALKMRHDDFVNLLRKAVLTHGNHGINTGTTESEASVNAEGRKVKSAAVKVQWDPERTPRLGKLDYRSIQIGVPGALSTEWAEKSIVAIEDVTGQARELKRVLDERPGVEDQELVEMGLVPVEREFRVPADVEMILRMRREDQEQEDEGVSDE
jgi:hypothetical protein